MSKLLSKKIVLSSEMKLIYILSFIKQYPEIIWSCDDLLFLYLPSSLTPLMLIPFLDLGEKYLVPMTLEVMKYRFKMCLQ